MNNLPEIKINNLFIFNLCKSIISSFNKDNINKYGYIFPGDPELFYTNYFDIENGAFGVLYSLKYLNETLKFDLDNEITYLIDYTINKYLYNKDTLPLGLVRGYAGIAWILLEFGFKELAKNVFEKSNTINLDTDFSLYYGKSGILMTNLKFYLTTKDKIYLESALFIANQLNSDLKMNLNSSIEEGYAGVSLAYLYLFLITKDQKFLKFSEELIKKEMNIYDFNKFIENGYVFKNDEVDKDIIKFSPYV